MEIVFDDAGVEIGFIEFDPSFLLWVATSLDGTMFSSIYKSVAEQDLQDYFRICVLGR